MGLCTTYGGNTLRLVFSCLFFVLASLAASAEDDVVKVDQLANLALVYEQRGYRQQAITVLLETDYLPTNAEEQDQINLKLAQLYFELGEYPLSGKRLDQINSAETSGDQVNSVLVKIAALNIQAAIHSTLNNPKLASSTYLEALNHATIHKLAAPQLITLTNHLRHAIDHQKLSEATEIANRVVAGVTTLGTDAQSIELKISAAELLLTLADVSIDKNIDGNIPAETLHKQAAKILRLANEQAVALHDVRLQSFAIGYHGQALLQSGLTTRAIDKLNAAAFLAESVNAFEGAYLWHWQAARAHTANGQTKAAIRRYETAINALEHVRSDLINGSPFTFPRKIKPLFTELSSLLLNQARESGTTKTQQQHLSQVQNILEQAKSAELQDYFQNDCVIPDEAVDLSKIDKATAVIYPVVLPDRVEVLVNIESQIYQYSSAISEQELERLVNDFRDNLQRDQGDDEYKEIGEEIYELLLAQLIPALEDNRIQTLLIIPDGSLRTIPFAAIYDGENFLVEKYAIATTPGISLTLPKELDVEEASLFAGGISDAVQGFSGLPGVPVELDRLQNTHGAAVLIDQEFHRAAIQEQLASEDYSIIHIATHGHFDSNPQKSFLLTYEDRLTMDLLEDSIGSRRLKDNPLELLVLSACETAVGDNRAALGLAGVALKAGARSAVATLWQISDAATVEIIQTFYQQTTQDRQTKAQALRVAQRKLIESERFYHPTDWAPFLLIGNWL